MRDIDFEKELANIASLTGKTGKDLDDIADRARELACLSGDTATEHLKAFSKIIMQFGPTAVTRSNPCTVDAARLLLRELEIEIAARIEQYQEITGMTVFKLDFEPTGGGARPFVFMEAEIEL